MFDLSGTDHPWRRPGSVLCSVLVWGHVHVSGPARKLPPGPPGPGSNNIPSSNLCLSSDQHFMRYSEDLQQVKKPVLRTETILERKSDFFFRDMFLITSDITSDLWTPDSEI